MVKGTPTPRELLHYYVKVTLKDCIKEKLLGSGFDTMFDVQSKPSHIVSLLSVLSQLYEVDTGAFKIGKNKIYFGLEDVLMITGLPIDGKPVVGKTVTQSECETVIGVKSDNNEIKLLDLVNLINGVNDHPDEGTLDKACRAAVLLGIACMVDPNSNGTIHTKYVHLVKDVNEIKDYAWGAASWVNLHTSLRTHRRDPTKVSILGCSFALMVFALVRIPNIVRHCYKSCIKDVTPTFPLRLEYIRKLNPSQFHDSKNRPNEDILLDVLSRQTPEELDWLPYKEIRVPAEYVLQKRIAESVTTVLTENFAIHHTPHVAYRQLMEREPNMVYVHQWVGGLPPVPEKRGRSIPKDMGSWLNSWGLRWTQLISDMLLSPYPPHPPSPQPHEPSSSQPSKCTKSDWNQEEDFQLNGTQPPCPPQSPSPQPHEPSSSQPFESDWNQEEDLQPNGTQPPCPPQPPSPQTHEPSPSQPSKCMESDWNQKEDLQPNGTQVRSLKKKLIVLDINGLLVDVVYPIPKGCNRALTFRNKALITRPSYLEFMEFCFDNFEVGIWSSKIKYSSTIFNRSVLINCLLFNLSVFSSLSERFC